MEDNITQEEVFAPSIYDVATTQFKEQKLGATQPAEQTNELDIDQETAEILVTVPFDIASYLTKLNDVKLTEPEAVKLGKLWRKPLIRLLSKYENSDVAIAAIATIGIAGEKYLEYQLEQSRRNSARHEGKRENELHQVKAL